MEANNVREMRRVIISLLNLLYDCGIDERTVEIAHENTVLRKSMHTERKLKVLRKAKAVLSAPLRNCDVGTVKEQSKRFDKFCYDRRSYEKGCEGCPFLNGEPCCELAWAQMPYKGEGTK